MKKILKLSMLFIAIISLTGCLKYNVNMEVNNDKSVDFELIYALNVPTNLPTDEEQEVGEDDYSNSIKVEDFDYLKNKGFKVEKYEDKTKENNYFGIKISKKYPNIDEITKDTKVVFEVNKLLEEENFKDFNDSQLFSKNGNNYVANFSFDMTVSDEEGEDNSADYSQLEKSFELKYTVKLPSKSLSNNATTVSKDGKTLTWDLKYGKVNQANYEFLLSSQLINGIDNNMLFIGAGALVLLALIIFVGNNLRNKKLVKDYTSQATAQPAQNVGPVVQAPVIEPVVTVQPAQNVGPVVQAPVMEPVVTVQPAQNVGPVVQAPVMEPVTTVHPVQNVGPVVQAPVMEPVVTVQPEQNVEPVVHEPITLNTEQPIPVQNTEPGQTFNNNQNL